MGLKKLCNRNTINIDYNIMSDMFATRKSLDTGYKYLYKLVKDHERLTYKIKFIKHGIQEQE